MIHVFFVPGMFGSTIEYVLRSYTTEYTPVLGEIMSDGSLHSYKKEFHFISLDEIANSKEYQPNSITTPIYPFKEAKLDKILESYRSLLEDSRLILVYADSLQSAELTMLFQYHKISTGTLNLGLDIFLGDESSNVVRWNPLYTSWTDMQPWELREWLSLFYVEWVQEWINSRNQVPDTFLKIKNTDMLFDTKETLLDIIKFCNLTIKGDITSFILDWQQKQDYIIREFNLLDQILTNTIEKNNFDWTDLNIIAESIIQQRLRAKGYEIRCDGLNTFPTNSITLYNLLEKC